MVSKLVNGKWVQISSNPYGQKSPKFRSNDEVRLISQKREWGVPFALTAQEFDIKNWFDIDTEKKTWALKPEIDVNYDIIMDENGKVVEIRHINQQYTSHKRKRDGRRADISYGMYNPHSIYWQPSGLLNEEKNWGIIETRERGDEDQYEYWRQPYLSAHKEWYTDSDQVMNQQALKRARTWETLKSFWEERDGDEDYEDELVVVPKTDREFYNTGIKKSDKYWDDYSRHEEWFRDWREEDNRSYLRDNWQYDTQGRPTYYEKWDDYETNYERYSDGWERDRRAQHKSTDTWTYTDADTGTTVVVSTKKTAPPKAHYAYFEGTRDEERKKKNLQRELRNAKDEDEKLAILEKYGQQIAFSIPFVGKWVDKIINPKTGQESENGVKTRVFESTEFTGSTVKDAKAKLDNYLQHETTAQRNQRYINELNSGVKATNVRDRVKNENPQVVYDQLQYTPEGRQVIADQKLLGQIKDPFNGKLRDLTADEVKQWVKEGQLSWEIPATAAAAATTGAVMSAQPQDDRTWEDRISDNYRDAPISTLQYGSTEDAAKYAYAKARPALQTTATVIGMPGAGASEIWNQGAGLVGYPFAYGMQGLGWAADKAGWESGSDWLNNNAHWPVTTLSYVSPHQVLEVPAKGFDWAANKVYDWEQQAVPDMPPPNTLTAAQVRPWYQRAGYWLDYNAGRLLSQNPEPNFSETGLLTGHSPIIQNEAYRAWPEHPISSAIRTPANTLRFVDAFGNTVTTVAPYFINAPAAVAGLVGMGAGVAANPEGTVRHYKEEAGKALSGDPHSQGRLAAEVTLIGYGAKQAYKGGVLGKGKTTDIAKNAEISKYAVDTQRGGPVEGTAKSKAAGDTVERLFGHRDALDIRDTGELIRGEWKNRMTPAQDQMRIDLVRSAQQINEAMRLMQGDAFGKQTSGTIRAELAKGFDTAKGAGTDLYGTGSEALRRTAPDVMRAVDIANDNVGGLKSDTDILVRKPGQKVKFDGTGKAELRDILGAAEDYARNMNVDLDTAMEYLMTPNEQFDVAMALQKAGNRKLVDNTELTSWADKVVREKGLEFPAEATPEQTQAFQIAYDGNLKIGKFADTVKQMFTHKGTRAVKNQARYSDAEIVGSFLEIMRSRVLAEETLNMARKAEFGSPREAELMQRYHKLMDTAKKQASEKDMDIHLFNKRNFKKTWNALEEAFPDLEGQHMLFEFDPKGKLGSSEPTMGTYTELPKTTLGWEGMRLEGAVVNKKYTPHFYKGASTKIKWLESPFKEKVLDPNLALTEQSPTTSHVEVAKAPPSFYLSRFEEFIDLAMGKSRRQRLREKAHDTQLVDIEGIGKMRMEKKGVSDVSQFDRFLHSKDIQQQYKGAKKVLASEKQGFLKEVAGEAATAKDIAQQLIRDQNLAPHGEKLVVEPDPGTYPGKHGARAGKLTQVENAKGEMEWSIDPSHEGGLDVKSEQSMLRHHTRQTVKDAYGRDISALPSEAIEKAQAYALRGKESDLLFLREYIKEAERWYNENYQFADKSNAEARAAWNLLQQAKQNYNSALAPGKQKSLFWQRVGAKVLPFETSLKTAWLRPKAQAVELTTATEPLPLDLPPGKSFTRQSLSDALHKTLDRISNKSQRELAETVVQEHLAKVKEQRISRKQAQRINEKIQQKWSELTQMPRGGAKAGEYLNQAGNYRYGYNSPFSPKYGYTRGNYPGYGYNARAAQYAYAQAQRGYTPVGYNPYTGKPVYLKADYTPNPYSPTGYTPTGYTDVPYTENPPYTPTGYTYLDVPYHPPKKPPRYTTMPLNLHDWPKEPDKQKKRNKYKTDIRRLQDPFYRLTGRSKYSNLLNKMLRERYGNIYS